MPLPEEDRRRNAELKALVAELRAAINVVDRNPANHIAARALADLVRPYVLPGDESYYAVQPVLDEIARGGCPDVESVRVLVNDAIDLEEFFQAGQIGEDAYDPDPRARRSRIKLVQS
jgi:hypothetical protein